jgi:hypothetical protein
VRSWYHDECSLPVAEMVPERCRAIPPDCLQTCSTFCLYTLAVAYRPELEHTIAAPDASVDAPLSTAHCALRDDSSALHCLHSELETLRRVRTNWEATQAEVIELRRQLTSAQAENDASQAACTSLAMDIASLRRENTALLAEVDALKVCSQLHTWGVVLEPGGGRCPHTPCEPPPPFTSLPVGSSFCAKHCYIRRTFLSRGPPTGHSQGACARVSI